MQDGVSAINDLVDKAAAKSDPPANDPPPNPPANDPPPNPPANDPPDDPQPNPPANDPPANDPPPTPAPVPEYIQNLLKEHGLSSVEELDGFLKKVKEPSKTPEQIKKEEEIYKAGLVDFAVKNDLLKMDDVVTLESIKNKSDEDLVFDQFAKDVQEEILEELGEDATEEDIFAKVRENFEKEYPVNSKNEKARLRAEAKIANAAKAIREPFERSFNDAKSRYDDEISVRNEFPKYQDAMTKLLNEVVPGKIDFFTDKDGDQDILADIPLTEDDKKTIMSQLKEKVISSPETFLLHKSGKVDQIKQNIKDQLDLIIYRNYAEVGKKKIADTYLSIGIKKGSDTGASNSFAAQQAAAAAKAAAASAVDQVLDSTAKK